MPTTTWTGETGKWTDPTWTDGVPDASLDAIADGTSLSPITITFDTPSGAAHSLAMADATLAVAGGTLALGNASSLDALTQSGGLLDLAAGGTLAGFAAQTAGRLEVDSGALLVDDGGSFGGALTGAGEITFAGGAVTLESGLLLSVATLLVADTTTLAGDITDTRLFSLARTGTLDLAGHEFTLGGTVAGSGEASLLSGLIEGSGTLALDDSRGSTVDGLSTTGSLTIVDDAPLDVNGLFTLGTAATDQTTLAIGSDGFFNLEKGATIAANGAALIQISRGGLEDTAHSGTISVPVSVDNSGLIIIGTYPYRSELLFSSGTFTNTGTVAAWSVNLEPYSGTIAFGPGVTVTNLVNGTLTGGDWFAWGGTIAFTGGPITTDAAFIDLAESPQPGASGEGVIAAGNGNSFTLLQDSLSTIAQTGELYLGTSQYVTKRSLVDNGELDIGQGDDQFGPLRIGATGSLTMASGTLTAVSIRNDGNVYIQNGGTALVDAPFASDGTLTVDGTLELAGASNFLGGTIVGGTLVSGGGIPVNGGGMLVLEPNTSTTIGAGARGSVAAVTLDGAALTFDTGLRDRGGFGAGSGSTIDLNGHTVKLAYSTLVGAPAANVLVEGGGTLVDFHAMTLAGVTLTGGTELSNTGAISQAGTVTLGDASGGTASLVNQAGATYTMAGAVALDAASATADTITNAGIFEQTGTGTATIGAALTNTGTIDVTSGTLEITAAFTNTGTIIGTETQSGGITTITAPSAALFNQYVAATPAANGAALAIPPPTQPATPTLAAAHAA